MRTHLLFLALVFACVQNAAACGNLAAILKNAYPNAIDSVSLKDDVRCKVWPAHPELTLIGVTIVRSGGDEPQADLDILVADSASAAVRYRLLEPGMLNADAYRKSFEGFDTANYAVAQGTVVFGVRTGSAAGGWGHGSSMGNLSLYALGEGRLARILDDLLVASEIGESEALAGSGRKNACGWREQFKANLVVGTTLHYGFKDIAVTASRTTSQCTSSGDDEQRWTPGKARKEMEKFVFNGARYVSLKK